MVFGTTQRSSYNLKMRGTYAKRIRESLTRIDQLILVLEQAAESATKASTEEEAKTYRDVVRTCRGEIHNAIRGVYRYNAKLRECVGGAWDEDADLESVPERLALVQSRVQQAAARVAADRNRHAASNVSHGCRVGYVRTRS